MTPVHLERINPDRNMARFYRIDVAPTLFGETSVLRSWGRIGTLGRTTIETCASRDVAGKSVARTVEAKSRRGYVASP
ncbi:WGR domain-containing protein [Nioella nitratireducens]|uniref:WGR domain-containing protein n=1 Tax=Nioella nitratireducens TaxID=1287720 RepID=UPI0008FD707A|nr:WGR domain-containing protein [Nioella nitratireducens]